MHAKSKETHSAQKQHQKVLYFCIRVMSQRRKHTDTSQVIDNPKYPKETAVSRVIHRQEKISEVI